MSKSLENKLALVTGASRGIGRAVAVLLAKNKARLILTARSEDKLSETCRIIKKQNAPQPLIIPADLSEPAQISNLTSEVRNRFDSLDILVNNAGVTYSGKLENTPTEKWDLLMNVNARAPFLLIRRLLDLLDKPEQSCIVNIASVVAVKGYPEQSAYSASKHALRGMTIALSEELRYTGINVRLLCSGGVDTDMVANVRPDIDKKDLINPEEIAELVLYLVTHEGNAVLDELRIRRKASSPWYST